ncbi:MAG: helix-turn-helix transcriptional regulator [Acidimicrobiia bacterium]|nr:helix-turn-helix transcriptional regulator [Acidimicrobiia bacterium]MXX46199.1 helix-turn-helix transcriptional regulator [Acidimicrobiia bacterium]MXY74489.1 helix-turn-helix transcriptional regulator [Acidimicrobiia bacterium]MYA38750.1 helix-turn-helix transcriptional regulator [Acidimicrobiia bacterium]MYB78313.1 helix-turn-helix transcriptional regulator [Acidimicrobiia bacterium]
MGGPPAYSPMTKEVLTLLGKRVRLGRLERRWTVAELATRVGVSPVTIRKVETGDPTVALGTALEAAVLVGMILFHPDRTRRAWESAHVNALLALLPATVRPRRVDDDF